MITVSDVKASLAITYPKLYTRFNQAFASYSDDTLIDDVITSITQDVDGWLNSMPENFKTTHHALSRPKFGILFALKNDTVRARLGEEVCDNAIHIIESRYDIVKHNIVKHNDEDILKHDKLSVEMMNASVQSHLTHTLSDALIRLLETHYDTNVADLFKSLIVLINNNTVQQQ